MVGVSETSPYVFPSSGFHLEDRQALICKQTLRIFKVKNAGRINVIGSLACSKDQQQLEYRLLEGKCQAEQVETYLETLAQQAQCQAVQVVIALDNAGFHKAKGIKQHHDRRQARGLTLGFQPPYSPQFNLIETVWKKLKAFLLPRRRSKNREELKSSLLDALRLLSAVEISHS
jgi:putative transposase